MTHPFAKSLVTVARDGCVTCGIIHGLFCGALSSAWFDASWWGSEGGDWVLPLSWPLAKWEVSAEGRRTCTCRQVTLVTVSGRQQRVLSSAGEMPTARRAIWIPMKDRVESQRYRNTM